MTLAKALVLASTTFNNTDQLKLLGFTNLKYALIDSRCSILVRSFLYEHSIEMTEVNIRTIASPETVYLFHDGHGNTETLLSLCDKWRQDGTQIYIFESTLIDPRGGWRPY